MAESILGGAHPALTPFRPPKPTGQILVAASQRRVVDLSTIRRPDLPT